MFPVTYAMAAVVAKDVASRARYILGHGRAVVVVRGFGATELLADSSLAGTQR